MGKARVARVRVDDGHRGARELAQREADLDEQWGHGYAWVCGHEADDARAVTAQPMRDAGAGSSTPATCVCAHREAEHRSELIVCKRR